MRREEWEQDLRDRQRNIVFPDTVRNQTNFYRGLLRGNSPLATAQRVGLVLLGVPAFVGGCFGLAISITSFRESPSEVSTWLLLIVGGATSTALCLFGSLLLMRALLPRRSPGPSNPSRNRRRLG